MARNFEPRFMKLGVLTAALQELTPREVRDADPDRAVEEWLEFARELAADEIQLSAALHPSMADVPEEAMLDAVANTLDLRQPFDRKRADRVRAAVKDTGVGIADIGYFDNMLHADPGIREALAPYCPLYETEAHSVYIRSDAAGWNGDGRCASDAPVRWLGSKAQQRAVTGL